ncbi:hypothetical protein [Streptomyces sp. SudanB25_2051]|uniref:hypothetical protein n=1 Tax=Streptomyces sp. SudanB25_2051 TaxID=3035275 RepID=UPI003F5501A5
METCLLYLGSRAAPFMSPPSLHQMAELFEDAVRGAVEFFTEVDVEFSRSPRLLVANLRSGESFVQVAVGDDVGFGEYFLVPTSMRAISMGEMGSCELGRRLYSHMLANGGFYLMLEHEETGDVLASNVPG